MKIVLASDSPVKIAACRQLWPEDHDVDLIPVRVSSGVSEQPIGLEETLQGAKNRLTAVLDVCGDADLTISIENGIVDADDGYHQDIFAVGVMWAGKEPVWTIVATDCMVQTQYVDILKERGPDKVTLGKILVEHGVVKQHDDPHLCLSGKSRADYTVDAIVQALACTVD